jgi:hypothetical protein
MGTYTESARKLTMRGLRLLARAIPYGNALRLLDLGASKDGRAGSTLGTRSPNN